MQTDTGLDLLQALENKVATFFRLTLHTPFTHTQPKQKYRNSITPTLCYKKFKAEIAYAKQRPFKAVKEMI